MKPHLFRKGLRSAVLRPSTQNDPCGMMFLPWSAGSPRCTRSVPVPGPPFGVVRRTGARSLLVAASAATLAAVTLTFRASRCARSELVPGPPFGVVRRPEAAAAAPRLAVRASRGARRPCTGFRLFTRGPAPPPGRAPGPTTKLAR